MPLKRFRDPAEARRALWAEAGDPSLSGRIRSLWDFTARLVPAAFPRGLRKYRSIEAANADREAWAQERIERLRNSRS